MSRSPRHNLKLLRHQPRPLLHRPPAAEPTKPPAPAVPSEHAAALRKAESYLKFTGFSKQGLYDQLTSEYGEEFPPEAAQYAIDNVEADWKEQALKKAISYRDTMSMSKKAIREQLVSEYGEKFTAEEADYAIANLPE